MEGKDRNGLKLEKVGPTLKTIPAKVTCLQLFPFKSFVPLILSKDFKGQWIILRIHSCSTSYFIRGFKQRRFWATQCQSEVSSFSLICLEAAKCVLLSVFPLIATICLKICKLVPRVFSFSKPRSPSERDRTKIKTFVINGSYSGWNISS